MRLIVFMIVMLLAAASFANDGVYVSGNTPQAQKRVDNQIEELINQMVIQKILADTGELVSNFMQSQNINVFPQVAYNAVQMIAVQVFKQDALKSYPQDAYNDALDKVNELRDAGASGEQMQQEVKAILEEVLNPLKEEYVYQEIIKIGIKEAMLQNRKIIVMASAQKQAQLMAMRQQQAYMMQVMQQAYQQAIQQAVQQQMQAYQKQRMAVVQQAEAQYQQLQKDYYQQQQVLQNQYEQEMRRRALMEQQMLRR